MFFPGGVIIVSVETRRSKIVSRPVVRHAATSVDHLRRAAILEIAMYRAN